MGVTFITVRLVLPLDAVIAIKSTEYFITSHKVYVKCGLIARRVYEIKERVDNGHITIA